MLADRVKVAVPNPGTVGVGSTITLGAAPVGYRSPLTAFGAGISSYFALSDAAGRTITGVWTANATVPETATITEIIWNDRLGSTAGETFASACTAWSCLPAAEAVGPRETPWGGVRNLIINGNFLVNQRGYVSGTNTSGANQYTLDRWRVVTSGQNISWTDSAGVRTVTFPAGGGEQVIEGLGLIGGKYVASWDGAGTITVGGAPVTKGAPFTVVGGADLTVRAIGVVSKLQIEPGRVKTNFEQLPHGLQMMLCQRYYCIKVQSIQAPAAGFMIVPFSFPVPMRTGPSTSNLAAGTVLNCTHTAITVPNGENGWWQVQATAGGGSIVNRTDAFSAEF